MIIDFDKFVLAGKFIDEAVAAGITSITNVETVSGKSQMIFSEDLNQEQLDLLFNLVTNHIPVTPDMIVFNKIKEAKDFGDNLIAEYGTRNVLRGMNNAQVREIMNSLSELITCLNAGSLKVALDILAEQVPDETLIRTVDLTYFRNKIQAYLGVPLT